MMMNKDNFDFVQQGGKIKSATEIFSGSEEEMSFIFVDLFLKVLKSMCLKFLIF